MRWCNRSPVPAWVEAVDCTLGTTTASRKLQYARYTALWLASFEGGGGVQVYLLSRGTLSPGGAAVLYSECTYTLSVCRYSRQASRLWNQKHRLSGSTSLAKLRGRMNGGKLVIGPSSGIRPAMEPQHKLTGTFPALGTTHPLTSYYRA